MDFVSVDLNQPLEAQGPFHMLVHKITDELADQLNPLSQSKIQALEEYVHRHPDVIEVDQLSRQRPLVDRGEMSRLIQTINAELPPELGFFCPNFVIVQHKQDDYSQLLSTAQVKFPVVCKTLQACGSKASHKMGIIFKQSELHTFATPFLIQEYINHNATIFKVFVIGDYLNTVRRKSLRNVDKTEVDSLYFDSQVPFPPHLTIEDSESNNLPLPPLNTIKAIAQKIRTLLGLSLFGFDVINNIDSNTYACVDINYFPGYAGVPDVFNVFLYHFQKSFLNKSSTYQ